MAEKISVTGRIVQGHRVASGQAGDSRFPEGTLRLQLPVFQALGLDLSSYYLGTINISIAPYRYVVAQPKVTFQRVKWAPNCPAEDFSFFDCELFFEGYETASHEPDGREPTKHQQQGEMEMSIPGLIYYPHPETKPEHFQDPQTLEVLAPWVSGLHYGQPVQLRVSPQQLKITSTPIAST